MDARRLRRLWGKYLVVLCIVPSPFKFLIFCSLLHISVVAGIVSDFGILGPSKSNCFKSGLHHWTMRQWTTLKRDLNAYWKFYIVEMVHVGKMFLTQKHSLLFHMITKRFPSKINIDKWQISLTNLPPHVERLQLSKLWQKKDIMQLTVQMNDIVSCGGSGNGHYYQETTNSNTCKAWYLYKIDSKMENLRDNYCRFVLPNLYISSL